MTAAQFVLRCCERFGKLPSEVLAEDGELLRLIRIEALGMPASE